MRRLDLGSVNWWDGMLVSSSHLVAQESYHDQKMQWVLRYGLPLYGVCPTVSGDAPALEIQSRLENDRDLTVQLIHCRAITPDGQVIHVADDQESAAAPSVVGHLALTTGADQVIPVYVRASGQKDPAGAPDSSGHPAVRHPLYEIVRTDEEAGNTGNCLKIAELEIQNYQVQENARYLPPAFAMGAVEPLRRAGEETARLAQMTLDELMEALRAAPPAADMHPWHLSARGFLDSVVLGWSLGIEPLVAGELMSPPDFVGGLRSLLRVFASTLGSYSPVRDTLDTEFLQKGGLPGEAGGLDYYGAVARYVTSPYVHEAMGRQLRDGHQLLESTRECLRFILGKLSAGFEGTLEAPRPKVTYRQQDHYLLDVGQIESSFTEESQVLYFRQLGTSNIRSVLFVLRNNAAEGVDERDVRLKGGVNDDRPLYCPELQPDFKERPGRIYLLMEVERGKRDSVDYITLRTSGVVNLEELLRKKDTDIRVYYL